MASKPRLPTLWEVPDALWERVEQILAVYGPPQPTRRPRVDQRRALDAIISRLRTGCQRNHFPRACGHDSTIRRTFQKWVALAVFEKIWAALVAECEELGQIDWQWQSVDTMMGKARTGGARRHQTPGADGGGPAPLVSGQGI